MKKLIIIMILITSIISCWRVKNKIKFTLDDQNLFVESFSSQDNDINRYSRNNKIYKVGKQFTFKIEYKNKLGVTKYLVSDNNDKWILNDHLSDKTSYLIEIIITINSGFGPFESIPGYNQTVYTYDYKLSNGELGTNEMTGLIENEKNIWIHPPRSDFFKILELNPYPYVKFPLKVGNAWDWELSFGNQWSDSRWMVWSGKSLNKIKYQIIEKKMVSTELGILKCYIIEGKAIGNLGETKLISYFNEKYGFVKLEYYNIDGSEIILSLIKRGAVS